MNVNWHVYKDVKLKPALQTIHENKELKEALNFRKHNRLNQQLSMRKPIIKKRVF